MVETKPYRSEKWHWHSLRDRYYHNALRGKTRVTIYTFVQYFCGPRYSFIQIIKLLSLFLLAITCLFNLKLIVDTNKRIEDHRIILELDPDAYVEPFNEKEYFKHLNVPLDQSNEVPEKFDIKVLSSRNLVDISVNGISVHRNEEEEQGRGIHVVVLHQTTGSVMSQRVFDTYSPQQDDELTQFLNSITSNRIFIFAVKDEASFHLQDAAREKMKELGSKKIDELGWRSMWGMVCTNQGYLYGEDLSIASDMTTWAEEVELEVVLSSQPASSCNWDDTPQNQHRKEFCSHFDGYGDLCKCDAPSPLNFAPVTGKPLRTATTPVAVIASNRPQYLYRMLLSLLNAKGVNKDMVIVYIDGHFEEPYELCKLFGIRVFQHVPIGVKNARISQHYKASLSATFNLHPEAQQMIILEEDLEVSPDFFSYFNQTMQLLHEDSSIYCISAWNDQGYEHSSNLPSLLYRVETMPGLGWMLKRSLFEEELEPHWPSQEKQWDWDMWMRVDTIRKGRECVIPDVSRTYHFGAVGVNMNLLFFETYFKNHALNKESNFALKDVASLKKSSYEKLMHSLVRDSKLLDHSKSPCDENFMPENASLNSTYVAYFRMSSEAATDVFLEILSCLKLWDLDVRGLHRGAFRTFIKKRHVTFVGYPASPYSLYKPTHVEPIFLETTKKRN